MYKTTKEMLKDWNDGKIIDSVEMGGISPQYENAIQQEIFPLCEKIIDNPILKEEDKEKINKFYSGEYDNILLKQAKDKNLTGVMAGAIKNVAWQFAKYGYDYMMNKAPQDRLIKVHKEQ